MIHLYVCSIIRNGKVREIRNFLTQNEALLFFLECKEKGIFVEVHKIDIPDSSPQPKREVQYIPPPRWGGRVVCVETGWIFTSISAAAQYMNGSQWALRKAVLRNTVYHNYHWRMYNDTPKKITKFT